MTAAELYDACNDLHRPQFNSGSPCFLCNADRERCPWTDLRPQAAWRSRLVTPLAWTFTDKHALFRTPGLGLNLWHVAVDVLHVMDLGIVQHIGGSALFMMVWDTGLPGSLMNRIEFIYGKLHEAFARTGTPAGEQFSHDLFVAMFDKSRRATPNAPPILHSKAAISRHCVPALALIVRERGDWAPATIDDIKFAQLEELLRNLTVFYDCIQAHDSWLPTAAAREARAALLASGVLRQSLCHRFMVEKNAGCSSWQRRPTTHNTWASNV